MQAAPQACPDHVRVVGRQGGRRRQGVRHPDVVDEPAVIARTEREARGVLIDVDATELERRDQEAQADPAAAEAAQIHDGLHPRAGTRRACQTRSFGVAEVVRAERTVRIAVEGEREDGEARRGRAEPAVRVGRIEEVVLVVSVVDRIEHAVDVVVFGRRVVAVPVRLQPNPVTDSGAGPVGQLQRDGATVRSAAGLRVEQVPVGQELLVLPAQLGYRAERGRRG